MFSDEILLHKTHAQHLPYLLMNLYLKTYA